MSATKCAEIVKEIGAEIRNGEHGAPGTAFMTVRELCDVFDISLVTAQRIVNRLKEDGLLVRSGRRTSIAARSARRLHAGSAWWSPRSTIRSSPGC